MPSRWLRASVALVLGPAAVGILGTTSAQARASTTLRTYVTTTVMAGAPRGSILSVITVCSPGATLDRAGTRSLAEPAPEGFRLLSRELWARGMVSRWRVTAVNPATGPRHSAVCVQATPRTVAVPATRVSVTTRLWGPWRAVSSLGSTTSLSSTRDGQRWLTTAGVGTVTGRNTSARQVTMLSGRRGHPATTAVAQALARPRGRCGPGCYAEIKSVFRLSAHKVKALPASACGLLVTPHWPRPTADDVYAIAVDDGLYLVDATTGRASPKLLHNVYQLQRSADGGTLYFFTPGDSVHPECAGAYAISTTGRGLRQVVSGPEYLQPATPSYAVDRTQSRIVYNGTLVDLHSGATLGSVPVPLTCSGVSWMADNRHVLCSDGRLHIIDVARGSERRLAAAAGCSYRLATVSRAGVVAASSVCSARPSRSTLVTLGRTGRVASVFGALDGLFLDDLALDPRGGRMFVSGASTASAQTQDVLVSKGGRHRLIAARYESPEW